MTHTLLPRSTGLHYALRALSPRVPNLKLLDVTVAYPGKRVNLSDCSLLAERVRSGIPPMGFGQSYYTLRSVFMDRVPPPVVHMHLRLFHVATEVPIGDLSLSNPTVIPPSRTNSDTNTNGHTQTSTENSDSSNSNGHTNPKKSVETDVPETERVAFDKWLTELWRTKDSKLDEFHQAGAILPNAGTEPDTVQVFDELKKHFTSSAKSVEIPLKLRSPREYLDAFCLFGPAAAAWTFARLRR